ncbi:MAG TPA: hypothetical protein VIR27_00965 [Mycobacteriales bacterium]
MNGHADLVDRLPDLLAAAPPEVLGRVVLSVAVMHQADIRGRCPWCQPQRRRRWWRRGPQPFGPAGPCPTRRMLVAELRAARMVEPTPTPP